MAEAREVSAIEPSAAEAQRAQLGELAADGQMRLMRLAIDAESEVDAEIGQPRHVLNRLQQAGCGPGPGAKRQRSQLLQRRVGQNVAKVVGVPLPLGRRAVRAESEWR